MRQPIVIALLCAVIASGGCSTSGAAPTGQVARCTPELNGPSIAYRDDPIYPAAEASRGVTGTVIVAGQVDAMGNIFDVTVDTSSGNESLDSAAVDAVKRWRYAPGTCNGRKIGGPVLIHVPFVL